MSSDRRAIFIGTVPVGAIFGAFTAATAAAGRNGRLSSRIALAGGLAGFGTVAALVSIRMVGMRLPEDLMPVWGHGILWAAGLCGRAYQLRAKQR